MKIKSVSMKNIRSYESGRVEFADGATLLSGDIGCGKSTILQAIEFALFGLKKGELESGEILRHGTNSGHVSVRLDMDGHEVTIERTLKRKNDSIAHNSCRLIIDNSPEELTPVELKSRILEMFGYSQDLLRKNRPLFRFTVYTPQEDMKRILYEPEDRLETLRSVFGIDKYGTIKANARIFAAELRRMKAGLEGELRELEADIGRKGEIESGKRLLEKRLDESKVLLAEAAMLADSKRLEIEADKQTSAEMHAARVRLSKKEAELAAMRSREKQVKVEIAETEGKIESYAVQIQHSPHDMAHGTDSLRPKLASIESERDALISSAAVFHEEMRKLQKIYSDGICGTCGQRVNPAEFLSRIESIKAKISETGGESAKKDAEIAEAKNLLQSAERSAQYSRIVSDLQERRTRLEKEAVALKEGIASAGTEIMFIRPQTEGFALLEERLSRLESEFTTLQKKKSEADKACAVLVHQVEDMERRLGEIREKERRAEIAQAKARRITDLVNWLDPFTQLMDEMEKRVMLSIQREFDEYFQKWFAVLMDDQLAVRIDERFAPAIEQNGYATEYENLSGGEKTSVALAYRLALNRVVNDLISTIKTKDIIILDEPTDGFSADQLDKLRDVIKELALGQIIIVSHEPKIDTYVDNVIRIYKENHSSRTAA